MPALGHEDEDQDQTAVLDDPNDDTDESAQTPPAKDPSVPEVLEEGEDARIAATDEGEDDGDDVAPAKDDKRKESAKDRRARQKAAKERDKQTIELLSRTIAKQNETVERLRRDFTVKRVNDLDERIATAINEAEQFDGIYYKAIIKSPEDARQAAKLRDEAKEKAWKLHNEKEQLVAAERQQKPAAEVPYKDLALQFLADKPWYNPGSGDEDSLIVEALDKAQMRSMNPNDPNYWTTLERKVKERLPHRFSDDDAQDEDDGEQTPQSTQRRKGPPTGGSSKSTGGGNQRQITLPKEMVEAMKEAGQWDDPKVRARVAQRYIDGVRNRQRNG